MDPPWVGIQGMQQSDGRAGIQGMRPSDGRAEEAEARCRSPRRSASSGRSSRSTTAGTRWCWERRGRARRRWPCIARPISQIPRPPTPAARFFSPTTRACWRISTTCARRSSATSTSAPTIASPGATSTPEGCWATPRSARPKACGATSSPRPSNVSAGKALKGRSSSAPSPSSWPRPGGSASEGSRMPRSTRRSTESDAATKGPCGPPSARRCSRCTRHTGPSAPSAVSATTGTTSR